MTRRETEQSVGNREPRPSGGGMYTQVRTWTYDPGTQRLTSVTMPETGTVTYGYDTTGTLIATTDAKGVRKEYTYDGAHRVTAVHYYHASNAEIPNTAVTYSYDSKPYDGSFTQYGAGRLTAARYSGNAQPGGCERTRTPVRRIPTRMTAWGG